MKGYSGIYSSHKYWGKKPVELYQTILDKIADSNSLIVDPFLGSGIIARACKQNEIPFMGCDINPSAILISRIISNPPTSHKVEKIFQKITDNCEEEIRSFYTNSKNVEASHILYENSEIKEVWVPKGRGVDLAKAEDWNFKEEHNFKTIYFKNTNLLENVRINVKKNQDLYSLFSTRAIKSIDLILRSISEMPKGDQEIAKFILTSSVGQMSKMVFAIKRRNKNSKSKVKYEVGSWVIGLWKPDRSIETNAWRVFSGRSKRLINALKKIEEDPINTTQTNNEIHLKDFREMLNNIEDNTIDNIITDPPHGDRVPYLELSEIWNAIIGEKPNYDNELIVSNSPERNKNQTSYKNDFSIFWDLCERKIKKGGRLILMFNTTDMDFWNFLKDLSDQSETLHYEGKFKANYSAGSVVQDNREGAMKYDWCVVFYKTQRPKKDISKIMEWETSWIT